MFKQLIKIILSKFKENPINFDIFYKADLYNFSPSYH